jgi:autotransporter adhesin
MKTIPANLPCFSLRAPVIQAALVGALLVAAPSYSAAASGGATTATACQQDSTATDLACGGSSSATSGQATALGVGSSAGFDGTAIGETSSATQQQSTAVGQFSKTSGSNATAIGASATAGFQATSLGQSADAKGSNSIAIGFDAQANNPAAAGAIAIGGIVDGHSFVTATGVGSVALGASASSSGTNSVAIGQNSSDGGLANVFSVGSTTQTRTITNVTAGVNATDAANVGQLNSAVAGVTSTANQALSLGQSNNQTIIQQGQQIVQIEAIVNGQLGLCTAHNGALQCSVTGQSAASAQGQGAIAVGVAAEASGAGAFAQGPGAIARNAGSVAIGAGAQALADPTTALGSNAVASANNAVALGANTLASASNSVALGQGSIADRPDSVSVGNAFMQRQITDVAAGTAPTDAVNVAQLRSVSTGAVGQANAYAAQGIAKAAALPQVSIPDGLDQAIGVQTASYGGYAALGARYAHSLGNNAQLNLGVALSTSHQTIVSAGAQWAW